MAELAVTGEEPKSTKLEDPSFFVNRELSWLEFNYRVLEEPKINLPP
jgi:polyphosphate kinase